VNKKIFSVSIAVFLLNFLALNQSQAVCPVCTIAIGAGVGLCRWLGIDDVLSGIWIGGLIVSMIGWTLSWLNKKQINFKFRWLVIVAVFYLIVIAPLYLMGIMGNPFNKFWGMDKLLLGMIFGTLAFVLAVWLNSFLKKMNQGKVFFPFQKVVLPVLFLVITTLIFHYIVGCEFF